MVNIPFWRRSLKKQININIRHIMYKAENKKYKVHINVDSGTRLKQLRVSTVINYAWNIAEI